MEQTISTAATLPKTSTSISFRALLLVVSILVMVAFPKRGFTEETMTYGSIAKFMGGIAAAYAIHELGHVIVAEATDTHLSWEIGTYNQPVAFTENSDSDDKGLALNAAGLFAQAAGAEVILQADSVDKNDAFVRGMMAWDIINPILYSLDYWFIRSANKQKDNGTKYQGDIAGIQHYSDRGTANGYALSITALALFHGYRFLKTQTWAPDWVKGETRNLSVVPIRSGGIIMAYEYRW